MIGSKTSIENGFILGFSYVLVENYLKSLINVSLFGTGSYMGAGWY